MVCTLLKLDEVINKPCMTSTFCYGTCSLLLLPHPELAHTKVFKCISEKRWWSMEKVIKTSGLKYHSLWFHKNTHVFLLQSFAFLPLDLHFSFRAGIRLITCNIFQRLIFYFNKFSSGVLMNVRQTWAERRWCVCFLKIINIR